MKKLKGLLIIVIFKIPIMTNLNSNFLIITFLKFIKAVIIFMKRMRWQGFNIISILKLNKIIKQKLMRIRWK